MPRSIDFLWTFLVDLNCSCYLPNPRWPTVRHCWQLMSRWSCLFYANTHLHIYTQAHYVPIAKNIAFMKLFSTIFFTIFHIFFIYCRFFAFYALFLWDFNLFHTFTAFPYLFYYDAIHTPLYLHIFYTCIGHFDHLPLSMHITSQPNRDSTSEDRKTSDHF